MLETMTSCKYWFTKKIFFVIYTIIAVYIVYIGNRARQNFLKPTSHLEKLNFALCTLPLLMENDIFETKVSNSMFIWTSMFIDF